MGEVEGLDDTECCGDSQDALRRCSAVCGASLPLVLRNPSLLRKISVNLSCVDLLRAAQSCRAWSEVALEKELWCYLDLHSWARQTFIFFSSGAGRMNTDQMCALVQLLKPNKTTIDLASVMHAWEAKWVDGDTIVTEPAFVERLPELLCRTHDPRAMVVRLLECKPVILQMSEAVEAHIKSTGQMVGLCDEEWCGDADGLVHHLEDE